MQCLGDTVQNIALLDAKAVCWLAAAIPVSIPAANKRRDEKDPANTNKLGLIMMQT